jgi:hypothetical protein
VDTIYDTIVWLASRSTGKLFPTVVFSADTDMATDGWISLTSTERPEVIVARMTDAEARAPHEVMASLVETRVNARLGRNDLRYVSLAGVEEPGPDAKGLTFQEFLKVRQPPRLTYSDLFDAQDVAEEVSQMSRADFERENGRIVVLR